MKNQIKKIALILAVTMLISVLVACSNDSGGGGSTGGDSEYVDAIPADVKFEGKTFTVLAREEGMNMHVEYEITADENETETVNQAVYQRNSKIENRFGCKINPYFIPGYWNDKDNFINTFKNSVMSDSQAFDIIMSQSAYMADLGLNEYYTNLYDPEFKYIDFNAPYYNADLVEELTINNQLFFLIGDYNVTYLESYYVLYFNKPLAADLNIGDLYELVRSGKWTYDKLIEYSRLAYNDADGDGYKSADDILGTVINYSNTTDAFFSQFDLDFTKKNEKGIPEFALDQSKVVSILRKSIDFFAEDCVYTFQGSSNEVDGEMPIDTIFESGRSLFYPERLQYASHFRSMDTDFGILPFPKWEESQEHYQSQSQDGYSVLVVPRDVPDKAFAGAMIEALNAESSAEGGVKSAYYDIALKDKYSRDDESGEMMDIALAGAKVDFGLFHCVPLGSATQIFYVLLPKKMDTFVSYWAENVNGYERSLKKILKTYGVEA